MLRPQTAQPMFNWQRQSNQSCQQFSQSRFLKETNQSASKKLTKRPTASRLTPTNMLYDKERLYSETMNLKQVIHELEDENTRLRTKLTFLDKENSRLNNYIVEGESASGNLCSKSITSGGERESSSILINLKKLLREAREQITVLEESNLKLKRTVKYTKINELEIESKGIPSINAALLDETGRLKAIVDELVDRQNEEIDQRTKITSLTHDLRCQVEENENLLGMKERYEHIIATLERRMKEVEEESEERESKLLKDLKQARLRIQDNIRKQEIYKNYISTLVQENANNFQRQSLNTRQKKEAIDKKNKPSMARPATALNTRKYNVASINSRQKFNFGPTAAAPSSLQNERPQNSASTKPFIPVIPLHNTKPQKQTNTTAKHQEKSDQKTPKSIVEHPSEALLCEEVKGNMNRLFERAIQQGVCTDSRKAIVSNKNVVTDPAGGQFDEEYSDQDFENDGQEEPAEEYVNDFEQEEEEHPERQQELLQQKQQKKKKNKKKPARSLAPLSELLGLRLRAQQYPLADLIEDIKESCPETIDIAQLADLLQAEPFYISPHLVEMLLQTIFQAEHLSNHLTISTENFARKIASIVMPYELPAIEDEEAMAHEIHNLLSQHWEDLMVGLERDSNGDGTITRKTLDKHLKRIGFTPMQLEMVASDLSLTCTDLDHLQYLNLYEIYFESQEQPIEEQHLANDQRDLNRRHTIREEQEQSESNDRCPPRRPQQLIKNSSFSMKGTGSLGDVDPLPSGLV